MLFIQAWSAHQDYFYWAPATIMQLLQFFYIYKKFIRRRMNIEKEGILCKDTSRNGERIRKKTKLSQILKKKTF